MVIDTKDNRGYYNSNDYIHGYIRDVGTTYLIVDDLDNNNNTVNININGVSVSQSMRGGKYYLKVTDKFGSPKLINYSVDPPKDYNYNNYGKRTENVYYARKASGNIYLNFNRRNDAEYYIDDRTTIGNNYSTKYLFDNYLDLLLDKTVDINIDSNNHISYIYIR